MWICHLRILDLDFFLAVSRGTCIEVELLSRIDHFSVPGMILSGLSYVLHSYMELSRRMLSCSQLLEELEEPKDETEVRMSILDEDFKQTAAEVIEAFEAWLADVPEWQVEEPNYEGVRVMVNGDDGEQTGWLLLRSSLHDPLVVVNAESEIEGGVHRQHLQNI